MRNASSIWLAMCVFSFGVPLAALAKSTIGIFAMLLMHVAADGVRVQSDGGANWMRETRLSIEDDDDVLTHS